jgi:hypothetical protein
LYGYAEIAACRFLVGEGIMRFREGLRLVAVAGYRGGCFRVGPVTPWTPRALVAALAALVLATAAGAVLVRHWLRIHRPNIQVKPHPDAPDTVRMRVTGTDVTGTVRIEPHPAQVSSQLERAPP